MKIKFKVKVKSGDVITVESIHFCTLSAGEAIFYDKDLGDASGLVLILAKGEWLSVKRNDTSA